jgi:hypothetical protein
VPQGATMFLSPRNAAHTILVILPLIVSLTLVSVLPASLQRVPQNNTSAPAIPGAASGTIYLPLVQKPAPVRLVRTVNAPGFGSNTVSYLRAAIFWFGRVGSQSNYADVRIAYNEDHVEVTVAVYDRLLWYDPAPAPDRLTAYDSVSFYLDTAGPNAGRTSSSSYRFDAQLKYWESSRLPWQQAYVGSAGGGAAAWSPGNVPFNTETDWQGIAPNQNVENRGWWVSYSIPFTSLGLDRAPAAGTAWGMAVAVHDRDDATGTPIPDQVWPEQMSANRPDGWGRLVFGLPSFTAPASINLQATTIRNGLNGAVVKDASVGSTLGPDDNPETLCPGEPDVIWNQWGNRTFGGAGKLIVQNQGNIADWPCFAKTYVTFPLDALPTGATIVSATLTLTQFGNAGAPGEAYGSLIQVMSTAEDWDETTLTWNNAPLALENVSQAWVDPDPDNQWLPRSWDVSRAVAQARAAGRPLRLVLYEADWNLHSGKYFFSSDVDEHMAYARPTLNITWGYPPARSARR